MLHKLFLETSVWNPKTTKLYKTTGSLTHTHYSHTLALSLSLCTAVLVHNQLMNVPIKLIGFCYQDTRLHD